jgi:hypothetical protein
VRASAHNVGLSISRLAKRARRGIPSATDPRLLSGMRVRRWDRSERVPPGTRRRGSKSRARPRADSRLERAYARGVAHGPDDRGRRRRSFPDHVSLGDGRAARAAVSSCARLRPRGRGSRRSCRSLSDCAPITRWRQAVSRVGGTRPRNHAKPLALRSIRSSLSAPSVDLPDRRRLLRAAGGFELTPDSRRPCS